MKRRFGILGALAMFGLALSASSLQAQTFATFTQQDSGEYWVMNDTNVSGTTTFSTPSAAPVFFSYLGLSGLPSFLQGSLDAMATFTSSSPSAATGTTNLSQQFVTVVSTLSFIGTTGATAGANLLTATFTYTFTATAGNNAASATSTLGSVSFTSDFLDFSNSTPTSRSVSLSFDSIDAPPGVTLTNSFIDSFTATASGLFSANPRPTLVPEVSTGMIFSAVVGLAIVGEVWRKRRRKTVEAKA
ncbi:MAG: hypothetical protein JSR82_09745 [Verrucomicrobia bacterium]|nr:hypothetical protein [Verrucomicrobiota bacterium]